MSQRAGPDAMGGSGIRKKLEPPSILRAQIFLLRLAFKAPAK